MHARKTRQRKKEHMQNLQSRAEELKQQQVRLRQSINEKNTASILVGLFSINEQRPSVAEDPRVEELLRRPVEEIPDATKIPELPALILPGQHNSKRVKVSSFPQDQISPSNPQHQFPDDGIDYELLGRDRSKCTPAELDQIRRERNRMHAKRTRDRKRLFMEEMEEMIKKLETENALLESHLQGMGNDGNKDPVVPPTPTEAPTKAPSPSATSSSMHPTDDSHKRLESESAATCKGSVPVDQIKSLLEAAVAFDHSTSNVGMLTISSVATAVSASTDGSVDLCSDQDPEESRGSFAPAKRRKLEGAISSSAVPSSITTPSSTTIGC
mmetsp:Transcript_7387/g.16790  ORF Transcript_7387/g.16790 Transcript_7387/m.16790 type:complete len:327 (+) Transcript_7387:326-1306(+)